jgi:hypothetical protein
LNEDKEKLERAYIGKGSENSFNRTYESSKKDEYEKKKKTFRNTSFYELKGVRRSNRTIERSESD